VTSLRFVGLLVAAVTVIGCQDSDTEGVAANTEISQPPDASTTSSPTPVPSGDVVTSTTVAEGAPDQQRCVSPTPDSEYTLEVWHSLGNDSAIKLLDLTDRFNALDTGVTIELESPGNYDQTVQALAAAAPEDRPDIVLVDHKSTRTFADSGVFVGPRECDSEALADLLPVIEATYTLDGDLLATPYNVSTPVLMFDAAVVARAGLDPAAPPRTLDELSAASEAVVTSGAAAHGFVAYDGYGPWFITQYSSRRGHVSAVPDNGRRGAGIASVDFATSEVTEDFAWLLDEVESGRALWIGGNPSGFDDLVRLSDQTDGAAFTISTSGAVGDVLRLIASGSSPGSVLGVAPMPGPGSGALVGGGAFWMVDSGDAERIGAAYAYLEWLAAAPQHAEFAGYTGFSPIRVSELREPVLVEAWAANPGLRVSFDQLADLPGDEVRAGPAWGVGSDINRVMYETMTEVIETGDVTGSLDRATTEVNALLDVYNSANPPD